MDLIVSNWNSNSDHGGGGLGSSYFDKDFFLLTLQTVHANHTIVHQFINTEASALAHQVANQSAAHHNTVRPPPFSNLLSFHNTFFIVTGV